MVEITFQRQTFTCYLECTLNSMNHQPSNAINSSTLKFFSMSLFLNHPSDCYFHNESLQAQPLSYCSVHERPILLKYVIKNNKPGES